MFATRVRVNASCIHVVALRCPRGRWHAADNAGATADTADNVTDDATDVDDGAAVD